MWQVLCKKIVRCSEGLEKAMVERMSNLVTNSIVWDCRISAFPINHFIILLQDCSLCSV